VTCVPLSRKEGKRTQAAESDSAIHPGVILPFVTEQQDAIVNHPADRHGRVLAGPGTGKSETVLRLAERLLGEGIPVRLVTFTRAATAELVDRIASTGKPVPEPTTLHSFALSILMANKGLSGLPEPVRIPDEFESRDLILPDLARRLRDEGFTSVRKQTIARLEQEMAARWESLNPELILLSDVDPILRDAYFATWQEHRDVFGYSLFAEMPYRASELLEDHPDLRMPPVRLLIIDEYQDLNRSEIALAEAMTGRNCAVLAVGDDDQSIYSWRMADPSGIRQFPSSFPGTIDYELTLSFRCGTRILEWATRVIQRMRGRMPRTPPTPGPSNPPGEVAYLRFPTEMQEQAGVARLCESLVESGISPPDIAILVRGDHNRVWSRAIRSALMSRDIAATDVEAALEPLNELSSRSLISVGRLATNRLDDLAWWQLLSATPGISTAYVDTIYKEARDGRERFATRLLRVVETPPEGVSDRARRAAEDLVIETIRVLDTLDVEHALASDIGWADWMVDTARILGIDVSDAFVEILQRVGAATPQADGLAHYLNQLEPVAKDYALKTAGVGIMTMARSKGLGFRAVVVMGVEDGVIPSPRARDPEEERRLLYVAITRAHEFMFLTMASRRTGPTARTGAPNVGSSRSRSSLLSLSGIEPVDGPEFVSSYEPSTGAEPSPPST
jgi:DNA helicase-2/ATP-dependent DNA helicase PcrA